MHALHLLVAATLWTLVASAAAPLNSSSSSSPRASSPATRKNLTAPVITNNITTPHHLVSPAGRKNKSINALPYTKIAAPVAHSRLGPVDYLHPLRTSSAADFYPAQNLLLYYAEGSYQDSAAYQGTINWTLSDAGLVVKDHEEIDRVNCSWAGIELVFDSLASYKQALGWTTPLVLVTEGDDVSLFILFRLFPLFCFFFPRCDRGRDD